ncbi:MULTISPECIES: hypothetical protein [Pantoea]|jgi:hypothetical protein|uniref:hypothetical protein n=1 Tax=unclassified Pantoea TaxID=2630326 RepID=UPI0002710E21|nr:MULTISPECIES: hypothetical protein [Pantoea]KAJ9434346.1 hypothetical protein PMI39_019170 [Pantoea sp. YR343]
MYTQNETQMRHFKPMKPLLTIIMLTAISIASGTASAATRDQQCQAWAHIEKDIAEGRDAGQTMKYWMSIESSLAEQPGITDADVAYAKKLVLVAFKDMRTTPPETLATLVYSVCMN